ncbi:uncharacterized protein LOC129349622 [Amphiprion ocellaris]|uniref:Uncharacterized protein n=1 Tax=Amphiprion ocellaris TaxID=80972 RepID=A0AAQ5ZT44_AMPOC|nr:uncharacterized protein LOC129349622 [Amphiprion ocellaris]
MGASSSSGGNSNFNYDLSRPALTNLYNTPVYNAERVVRPLDSSSKRFGKVSHSGVRVTLADNSQYLVHKGDGYGKSSQTVVTDAQHMKSDWKVTSARNFQGTKTVSDFVKTGHSKYNMFTDNCHQASNRMMKQ